MLIPMTVEVPPYQSFLWPALQTVIALGGSASIAELEAAVIEREDISPEVQGVLHGDGPMTEVQYRLAWARTYLKGMGLLTNSQRGVWSVTENGQTGEARRGRHRPPAAARACSWASVPAWRAGCARRNRCGS